MTSPMSTELVEMVADFVVAKDAWLGHVFDRLSLDRFNRVIRELTNRLAVSCNPFLQSMIPELMDLKLAVNGKFGWPLKPNQGERVN